MHSNVSQDTFSKMELQEHKKPELLKKLQSPKLRAKDPSLSASGPSTSRHQRHHSRVEIDDEPKIPFQTRCCQFLYNKDYKTFCGRTCKSWLYITIYSIVYLCFLTTYTMIVLFCALWCIRLTTDFNDSEKISLLTYSEHGIGLSMTPISESFQPVIWYRKDYSPDYEKYVNVLDNLLVKKRRKRHVNLGPCGVSPYGYAENTPCVIIRINKQLHWAGKPLDLNSSQAQIAPAEVQNWIKTDKKLWLHCEGYHPYDKEHVGRIQYYPDPPGFDPGMFPLEMESDSPLVAMQISDFTLGLSLSVECKLWYANGLATVDFMLYVVASNDKTVTNRSNV